MELVAIDGLMQCLDNLLVNLEDDFTVFLFRNRHRQPIMELAERDFFLFIGFQRRRIGQFPHMQSIFIFLAPLTLYETAGLDMGIAWIKGMDKLTDFLYITATISIFRITTTSPFTYPC